MFLVLLAAVALCVILPLVVTFSVYSLRYLRYSREEIANTAQLNVLSARTMTEMYQDTVTQAATLILMDPSLGEIGALTRLDGLRGSFETYRKLNRVVSLLASTSYISSLRVDSVYFYVDGADYIITSDQGAVRLAQLADAGFRDVYDELTRNPHQSLWTVRAVPLSTITGDETATANYLTYANMANPIISKIRGAIIVNIREGVLSDLINTRDFDKGGSTFIVDAGGTVLSHVDKARILRPAPPADPRSLYVSALSEKTGWRFISEHSLGALTGKIRALTRTSVLVILLVVLAGSCVVMYVASRISAPLGKLMGALSQWNPVGTDRRRLSNEFAYLLESFQRIREHEAALYRTIDRTRDRLWESYIVDLLRGERDAYAEEPFPDSDILPEGGWFRVIVFSVDRRAEVESRLSQEQRFSCLSLMSEACQSVFPGPGRRCIAVLMDGAVAALVTAETAAGVETAGIRDNAGGIQERFAPMLGTTLTAGISGLHPAELSEIPRAHDEARDAVRQRIVAGYGGVHAWAAQSVAEVCYPRAAEERLLNCLRAGDAPGAEAALGELCSVLEDMPPDDIARAIEQACAALARFMRDSEIRLEDARGIFDGLAGHETLEEMKAYLTDSCRLIAAHTGTGSAIVVDRIQGYIRTHYTEIIDFEEMARSVGVSYSYMRRIMRDRAGTSILEHQHSLRIGEAERLLADQGLSISAIARRLGYNNIQSFERFFKKHKGISAQECRRLRAEIPRP
jgi:AraC-like DNA-binding protein